MQPYTPFLQYPGVLLKRQEMAGTLPKWFADTQPSTEPISHLKEA